MMSTRENASFKMWGGLAARSRPPGGSLQLLDLPWWGRRFRLPRREAAANKELMTKKHRQIAGFILIVMPSIGLANMIASPRWAAIRSVDITQLLGTGACLGAGFILLLIRPKE
jgi:hypothetical protein